MAYPSLEQYNQAFQLHSKLLTDPELKSGTVATTGLGLPLAISGGFALTYTIKTGAKKYAVRCFHRESKALERRYEAISKKIASLRSPYFLDFLFQPQGIKVDGVPYPIVKMAWANGETLGEFLEGNKNSPQAIAKLLNSIESLAAFLDKEKIAHGDFSDGNLMVSNGGATIQLIDYDGMFVDEIKALGSTELGNVNFQHPKRTIAKPFDHRLDRFSLISLWLALKALQSDPSTWDKTNSESVAIVFRANDFADPGSSPVFGMLAANRVLSAHIKNFAAICVSAMEKAPTLADFIAGKNIPTPAFAIRITGSAQPGKPKPGYISSYDVLSANNYDMCLRHVGDKVEVIGKIITVKENSTPYIFINFGDWRGRIFKIAIWSEGLRALRSKPDQSWVGKWISVIGLMDPVYVGKKYTYSHLSITITAVGQMTLLSEDVARWRLAEPRGSRQASTPGRSNNEALVKIKGSHKPSVPTPSVAPTLSANQALLNKIKAAQHSMPTRQSTYQPSPPIKQPGEFNHEVQHGLGIHETPGAVF